MIAAAAPTTRTQHVDSEYTYYCDYMGGEVHSFPEVKPPIPLPSFEKDNCIGNHACQPIPKSLPV